MVIFKTVCTGVSVRKYIFASVYDADDHHCRSAQIFVCFAAIVLIKLFVVHAFFVGLFEP